MTLVTKHAFQSSKINSSGSDLVSSTAWNADHALTAAANTILGSITGTVTDLTATQIWEILATAATIGFDAIAPTTTRGDLIYRNATTNTRLAATTSGYLLQTSGVGTDPSWAGFLPAGSGAVTRTWQDKAREIVSVKDFGAVGNGIADDSAAILNALQTVADGVTLLFPPGIYNIGEIAATRTGSIYVSGYGATLVNSTQTYNAAGAHNTPILRIFATVDDDITVAGLAISGPRLTSSTTVGEGSYGGNPLAPGPGYPSGLDIPIGRTVTIQDCRIDGTYYAGMEIHYSTKVTTSGNVVTNQGYAGILIADSVDNDVYNNVIDDIGSVAPTDGWGVTMSTSYNTPDYLYNNRSCAIHQNYVTRCKRKGLDVHNGYWGTIHDNFVKGAAYAHIYAVCEGDDKTVKNWDIHDNHCEGDVAFSGGATASAAISFGSFGSDVSYQTNYRVHGNHLQSIVAPIGISASNNDTAGKESITISVVGNTIAEGTFSDAAISFNNYTELYDLVVVANNVIDADVTNVHVKIRNAVRALATNNLCEGTSGAAVAVQIFGGTTALMNANVLNGVVDGGGIYQPLSANLTSWAAITRASGFDTWTATPSSANLQALVTDETGTGALVFATAPTFATSITTPSVLATGNDSGAIGASGTAFSDLFLASGAVINFAAGNTVLTQSSGTLTVTAGTLKIATPTNTTTSVVTVDGAQSLTGKTYNGLTISTTTGTFTLTNGKTLSVAKSLTLDGTDSTTMTFPTTSATIARTDAGQTFTGASTTTSWIANTTDARGVWTTGTSWTLPALTLGGTVSGGGNQLNNIIIGTSTPLAGSFTTLTADNANIYGSGTPRLRVAISGSTSSYCELKDAGATQMTLSKVSASGTALIDIDPIPSDGSSAATFRFFRSTNTSGSVAFEIYKGDGSGTLNAKIGGNVDSSVCVNNSSFGVGTATPGNKLEVVGTAQVDALRIDATPTAVSGAGPLLIGSASTLNTRILINMNGTSYWVPASTTAF